MAAAIYDDRLERKGTASLWRRGDRLCEPGEPLTGQVLWDEPEGYEPAKRVGDEPIESEERYHGSTQVLITSKDGPDGGYMVSVNGKVEKPDAKGVIYLRSFQGPFRVDATDKDIVGPVTIGLLTKTGTHAPSVATVSVVQTTVMTDSTLPENVLQVEELPCGNEQDVTLPALSFPYPARFTESPYIEIQSVALLQAQQRKKWSSVAWSAAVMLMGVFVLVVFGATTTGAAVTGTVTSFFYKNVPKEWVAAFARTLEGNIPNALDLSRMFQAFKSFIGLFGLQALQNVDALTGGMIAASNADGTNTKSIADRDRGLALAATKAAALSVATGETTVKKYRKYTIRSLTQTLRNLTKTHAADQYKDHSKLAQSKQIENTTVRVQYASAKRNESVLVEYLTHSEKGLNWWMNYISAGLQWFGMAFPGFKRDKQGEAQTGLFIATPGSAKTRGLQWSALQTSYMSTVLDVSVSDMRSTWKVRIEAAADVAFAAGYHASGLVNDLDELQEAIKAFKTLHEPPPPPSQQPNANTFMNVTAAAAACVDPAQWFKTSESYRPAGLWKQAGRVFSTKAELWNKLVSGTNERLVAGAEKMNSQMSNSLKAFKKGRGGTPYEYLMKREPSLRTLPPMNDVVCRFLPQRVASRPSLHTHTNVNTIGVSGTDDDQEELRDALPIGAAFEETRRAMRSYGLTLKAQWDRWEASSCTRLVWYEMYVPLRSVDAFENRALGVPVPSGVSFCVDGQLLPLQIRDMLQWWTGGNHGPPIETAVRLISTKGPTEIRETPNTSRREGARSATQSGQVAVRPAPPTTVAELLAAHSVADALIARVIMRTRLSESMRISTTAIDALRALIPRVMEVLRACRTRSDGSVRGILSENDPMFVCLQGGADAARILHCLGAWTRRAHVSIDAGTGKIGIRGDETREQRLGIYNAWTVEANGQFEGVLRVLERTTMLSLASMPIYALQNALTDDPNCATREFDARLCEALASFGRTAAFGEALGLEAQALNPVRLRLAAHWPVVLAARLASGSTDAFRSRLASLQTCVDDANAQLVRVADDEPLDAEALRKRNGSLRIDLETFEDFREEHYANDDDKHDTQRFFVPFSHGHVPHSRVWSLVHPGFGGIDSAPVRCKALFAAIGQCLNVDDDANESAAVRVAPHTGVSGAHPFCVQLERSSLVDVACCLITPMVTGAVGASAKLDPLDFADAAHAVLTGKDVLQRGSLVDVLCWNAERLVQAVLLAFGRVQPPKGRITVDCVPPDPPTFAQPLLDRNDTDVGRKARTDASIEEVIGTVIAHRYHLREACAKQLKAREDYIEDYKTALILEALGPVGAIDQMPGGWGVFNEGLEDGIDDEHVAGLHEMLQMMDIGASQDPTDVGYDAYTTEQAAWSDAYTATFFDADAILDQPSLDEALAYHCAHETERVYKLLKKEADARYAKAGLDAVEGFDQVVFDAGFPQLLPFDDFKGGPKLDMATNNVHATRREHHELKARLQEELELLDARKAAVRKDADMIIERNGSAFCASVALASAILVAILGSAAAPRLRLALPPRSKAPKWVRSVNPKEGSGDLSLFEAAIVLEQAVRSYA